MIGGEDTMKKLLALSLFVGALITPMPSQNIEILPLRPLEVGMQQTLLPAMPQKPVPFLVRQRG